jgi:hypothetical protein
VLIDGVPYLKIAGDRDKNFSFWAMGNYNQSVIYRKDFLKLIFDVFSKLVATSVMRKFRLFCSQTIKYAKGKIKSIEPTDRTASSF